MYRDAGNKRLQITLCSILLIGEELTLHTLSGISLKAMKAMISPRAHVEMAKGSEQQNIDYCQKEGDYFTKGDTIESAKNKKVNDTIREIIKCTDNNPEQFILKRDDSDTINAYKSNVRAIEKLWHENQQIATNAMQILFSVFSAEIKSR